MTQKNPTTNASNLDTPHAITKRNKITYWVSTLLLALGMLSIGIAQLVKTQGGPSGAVETITRLGYPIYFLTILGIWKLMGVLAVVIPNFPLLKEWAYAGFVFVASGAVISHIASGDSVNAIFPSLLLLILIVISWYFRPTDRKLIN